MLEWSVLNELGFKLDIVTPVSTTQSLLKLLNNQFGSQPEILTLAIQITYLALQSKKLINF